VCGFVIEIRLERPANDGASVGHEADGRVVFAEGGLPGETVMVELHTQKKSFAKGRVVEVLDASPERVAPACRTHVAGCGGCDLAHTSSSSQASIKQHVVRDSLLRIARLERDDVEAAIASGADVEHTTIPSRYRTTVRLAIDGERAGYRRRSSHDVVLPDQCLVAHEQLESLIGSVRFGSGAGSEVVMRVSDHSGEAMVVVDGDPNAVDIGQASAHVVQRESAETAFFIEVAALREWQVSADSFFQAGPQVATALVDAVAAVAGDVGGLHLVDAYSGVGLFAGTIGANAASVIAIEQSKSSTIDARANLGNPSTTIEVCAVERWSPTPADIVIADPSRAGLGAAGVDVLAACGAARFVLVSCDPGSLGRDVQLLSNAGYVLRSVQVIDAFHDTSHIESVVLLER